MSIPWVNKVMLVGEVVEKPKLRNIPGNYVLGEFTLNVTREIRRKNGDKIRETTLVSIISWGATAENLAKYLAAGRIVHVEGRLQYHEWVDKSTGAKRTKHDIIAENVIYLDKPAVRKPSLASSPPTAATPSSAPPKIVTLPAPAANTPTKKCEVTAGDDIPLPIIPPVEYDDPDPDEKLFGQAPELEDDQEDNSPWDVVPISRRRSENDEEDEEVEDEDEDEDDIEDDWEDELQIPYRSEGPLYRADINHDEWKNRIEEYDNILRQRERMDLSQEDHDELEARREELKEEIESMYDFHIAAEELPKKRY